MAEASADLASSNAEHDQVRAKVTRTASTVANRAAKTATREVAAMPGEALPFVGTAVIIGATALELADLCLTIKCMTELQNALNPGFTTPEDQILVHLELGVFGNVAEASQPPAPPDTAPVPPGPLRWPEAPFPHDFPSAPTSTDLLLIEQQEIGRWPQHKSKTKSTV